MFYVLSYMMILNKIEECNGVHNLENLRNHKSVRISQKVYEALDYFWQEVRN